MRTSFSFLRSLSSLRQYSTNRSHTSSAVIVPVHSDQFSTFDNNSSSLSNDLKSLPVKSPPSNYDINIITADHLFDLISSAVSSQKHALEYAKSSPRLNSADIDEHLEDDVVLLDACRSILEKMDLIKDYVESVRTATRLVDRGTVTTTDVIRRVNELLDNKKYCGGVESGLERSYSSLLKRATVKSRVNGRVSVVEDEAVAGRILSEYRIESLKACRLLESAMSFKCNKKRISVLLRNKSRRKVVGQMGQLKEVVVLAERLRDFKSGDQLCQVLDKKCTELVNVVDRLEIGVRDLYSQLISVRMMLL